MRTRISLAILLLAIFTMTASAQINSLAQTTTSAALSATGDTVALTSLTGISAGKMLYIDRERMRVISTNTTLSTALVRRHVYGIQTAHASGATVYAGDAEWFYNSDPAGPCTLASVYAHPWINTDNGWVWNCSSSLWVPVIPITPTPTSAAATSIGSATLPYKYIYFAGDSSTPASNNYKVTGTATAARTLTLLDASITLSGATAQYCGATASCSHTDITATLKVVQGSGTLVSGSPSTFAVTGISPAFTSASTYTCVAQDTTTVANNIGVLAAGYVSGSAVTFTGPNTNTDGFKYTCIGY